MSANERMRAAGERAQRRRAGLDPAAETAAAAAMQPQTVPFGAPGTTSEERAARARHRRTPWSRLLPPRGAPSRAAAAVRAAGTTDA